MNVINMYITMLPVISGGILNMIFTKTSFYKNHRKPIDCGKNFIDGKRFFGNNKTWTGFFSMIVFCTVSQILWGLILNILLLSSHNEMYTIYKNSFSYNIYSGALLGFAYMISELPNSFLKRRINIPDGKTIRGFKGALFFIADQIDSMIGVMLVLVLLSKISFAKYAAYVILGGITHIVINLILYKIKIRRNI